MVDFPHPSMPDKEIKRPGREAMALSGVYKPVIAGSTGNK
jgi:hypothetical protein